MSNISSSVFLSQHVSYCYITNDCQAQNDSKGLNKTKNLVETLWVSCKLTVMYMRDWHWWTVTRGAYNGGEGLLRHKINRWWKELIKNNQKTKWRRRTTSRVEEEDNWGEGVGRMRGRIKRTKGKEERVEKKIGERRKKKQRNRKRRREDHDGDKDLLVSSHWRPEATCHPGSLRPGRLWQNLWENTNPPPPVHPRREGREEEEEEKKRVKKRIIKDLVGFAMHRDRLADKWQPGEEEEAEEMGGVRRGGWGGEGRAER